MIHYHGTPITPDWTMEKLAGRNFCVSYANPQQIELAHRIGQSVMLDSGAFTAWTQGRIVDWDGYADWCRPWLEFHTTWHIIPDVIDGDEEENDLLLSSWHNRRLPRGAPVWHMHESIDRLKRLCRGYDRVCIGSSAEYKVVRSLLWHKRIHEAMDAVCINGVPNTWLHMLRGMALSGTKYPFASVDSTDIARNHKRPQNEATKMAQRWDGRQNPARWETNPFMLLEKENPQNPFKETQ